MKIQNLSGIVTRVVGGPMDEWYLEYETGKFKPLHVLPEHAHKIKLNEWTQVSVNEIDGKFQVIE